MLFLEFRTSNGRDVQIRADQYRGCDGDDRETRISVVSGGIERTYTLARPSAEVKAAIRDAFEEAQFIQIA